jgi:hypothetical protein
VVAVHQIAIHILIALGEEVQHHFLLLQRLLPPGQLDAAVGAVLEGFKGLIEVHGLSRHWPVDCLVDRHPINVLIVLQNLYLQRFFCDFVLDAFPLELFQDGPDGLLKRCGDIQ